MMQYVSKYVKHSEPLYTSIGNMQQEIRSLGERQRDIYLDYRLQGHSRADRSRCDIVIEEFLESLSRHVTHLTYHFGYKPSWKDEEPRLYAVTQWIAAYRHGIYSICDASQRVRFLGASYGQPIGELTNREEHRTYLDFVDVILFDKQWLHLQAALEMLLITRIRPDMNKHQFRGIWIEPIPPWNECWTNPKECN